MKGHGVGYRKNAWLQQRLICMISYCDHMLQHGCNVLVQCLLIHCEQLHCQHELVGHCRRGGRCGVCIPQCAAHCDGRSRLSHCGFVVQIQALCQHCIWVHCVGISLLPRCGSADPYCHELALECTMDKCLKRHPCLVVCRLSILKLLHWEDAGL
jgi:hypothetical protein